MFGIDKKNKDIFRQEVYLERNKEKEVKKVFCSFFCGIDFNFCENLAQL